MRVNVQRKCGLEKGLCETDHGEEEEAEDLCCWGESHVSQIAMVGSGEILKMLTNILEVCAPLPADDAGASCRCAAFGSMLDGHAFGPGCCRLAGMVMACEWTWSFGGGREGECGQRIMRLVFGVMCRRTGERVSDVDKLHVYSTVTLGVNELMTATGAVGEN